MSQTYHLDQVIRRVNEDIPLDSHQKLIIVDANSKKVLPKEPLFSIGKDIKRFLISTRNTAICEGPEPFPIKDLATGKSITIKTLYEVSCSPGKEHKLALSCLDGEHPESILNKLIEASIRDFARNKKSAGVDFIQEFFRLKTDLMREISKNVLEGMGLNIDLKVTLEYENQLAPYTITTRGFFPVYVKDCNDELNLKFKTELHVIEENKIEAILSFTRFNKLENLIKSTVKDFLLKEITLHQFYYDLNGKVRNRLITAIDEILYQQGRRVAVLSLESTSISVQDDAKPIKHNVECEIKGYSESITVEHKLLLSLEDLGRFKASRIADIDEWARKELDKATKSVFFDKTYAEIILEFDPDEIRNDIRSKAQLVGYSVKQLIIIPNLEPLKLRDGFIIDHKGKFATHDSRVEVGLNIVTSGVIRNLKGLGKYLTPKTRILDDIEEALSKEVQKLMHGIEPERFYMRFNYTDIEGETPVDQELRRAITEMLQQKFLVEDVHVTLKIMETELTERFQKLQQNSPYYFDITAFPLRDGGRREQVTFKVELEILRVDKNGWYIFQSKKFQSSDEEIKKIQEVLNEDLRAKLDTIPVAFLQYDDIKKKYAIEENLLKPSILKIMQRFGLFIDISLRRLATDAELAEQKKRLEFITSQSEADIAATERTNQALLDELEELFKKRQELIAAGVDDDDPDMINVQNRIQGITKKISSYSVEHGDENIKQLTTGSSKDEFSFDDYKKVRLPAGHTPKQIEGKKNKKGSEK